MTGPGLWLRLLALTALAAAVLVAVTPAVPACRLSWLDAAEAGMAVGAALFMVALRTPPRLPAHARPLPVFIAKHGLLGLWAANEEILWRRLVLGELLFGGAVAALTASSLAFALAHRGRYSLHFGTGAAFGGLYIATGALAASIAAHWTYNVLVAGLVDRSRSTPA